MKNVLVTGGNGQLGRCISDISSDFHDLHFLFASKKELNIENRAVVKEFFRNNSIDYCINAAAYTNVEKAESDQEKAFQINAEGARHLALECQESNTILIQISTDYVFDGKKDTPYRETDKTNPLNVYGASKLRGEEYIKEICDKYFIVRTSWLYSQYGHNFFKTILKKIQEEVSLTITTEQTGTPTNANDLAKAILTMIVNDNKDYGIYHYSNSGEATWYDFAKLIIQCSEQLHQTKLEKTNHYRTFAARPKYSVLNTEKYCNTFQSRTMDWEKRFQMFFKQLN